MHQQAKDLKAFLDAVHANPYDVTTRRVLADWYDEHDEPELADEQRVFDIRKHEAEQRFKKAVSEVMPYSDPETGHEELLKGALEGEVCFNGSMTSREEFLADYPEFFDDVQILAQKQLSSSHRENTTFLCGC